MLSPIPVFDNHTNPNPLDDTCLLPSKTTLNVPHPTPLNVPHPNPMNENTPPLTLCMTKPPLYDPTNISTKNKIHLYYLRKKLKSKKKLTYDIE